MRKRTFVLLLVLFSVFNAFAQTFEQGGIFYEVIDTQNNLISLIWGGDCKGDVVLPESVTYNGVEYTIDNIEDRAFLNCSGMTSIVIPEGVIRIGTEAFNYCSSLKSVSFPSSIAEIFNYYAGTFTGCDSLTSINNYTKITYDSFHGLEWYDKKYDEWYESLPEGIIREGNVVLGYKGTMPNNTSLVIPDGVTHIMGGAFYNDDGLISLTIPPSVTYIGGICAYCNNLTTVKFSSGIKIKKMGRDAFKGTPWYNNLPDGFINVGDVIIGYKGDTPDSLVIPNGITRIADYALSGTQSKTITIPSSVQAIGEHAFSYNNSLVSITMSDGLKSIGMCAFYSCNELKNIVIPQSVINIGCGAFQESKKLESVYLPDGLTNIRDDIFFGCESLKSIVLPDGVVIIGEDAFEKCNKLESVNIPDKVRRIGQRAFYNCFSLAGSIDIPVGVKEIANNTFFRCGTLTSVSIPNGLKTIGERAFDACSSITLVTIPESVTFIGEKAFENCTNLTDVVILGTPRICYDAFMSPNIVRVTSKSSTPGIMDFNIPFICDALEDIVAYGGKTIVYDSTLHRTIAKVEFPNNNRSCYVNMNNIPAGRYRLSVGILPSPDTIPNVLHPVITGMTDNGNVVLFDSAVVKQRGSKYVTVPYVISNKDKYKIDTIVTTINVNGLDLEEVHYKYTYVSDGYDTLTIVDEFVVPDGINSLKIEFQSNNEAGYLMLDSVFFEPLGELASPASYSGPFTENVFNNATLYVPEDAIDAYRAADGWKWFKNIAIDTSVDPIRWDNKNNTGSPVIYDMLGRKVMSDSLEGLQPGLYIINGKKYLKR